MGVIDVHVRAVYFPRFFKAAFNGVKTDRFTLFKAGGAAAPGEINGVSGATISSSAVVNAVNAAVDFFKNEIQQGGN